jgi:hypothetical protein
MDIEREILAEEIALQGPLETEFPVVLPGLILFPCDSEVLLKVDIERQRLVEEHRE